MLACGVRVGLEKYKTLILSRDLTLGAKGGIKAGECRDGSKTVHINESSSNWSLLQK